jgi:hypothetical protein
LWRSQRHRQGDWSGASAEVKQMSRRSEWQVGAEEQIGPRVDVTAAEDATIGFHHERSVGEHDVDHHRGRRHGGVVIEVVSVVNRVHAS